MSAVMVVACLKSRPVGYTVMGARVFISLSSQ